MYTTELAVAETLNWHFADLSLTAPPESSEGTYYPITFGHTTGGITLESCALDNLAVSPLDKIPRLKLTTDVSQPALALAIGVNW